MDTITEAVEETRGAEFIPVAPAWAGHTVGFALLTHENKQFVAFYDAVRQLTVAARTLPSRDWQFVTLPETLGWDSHNDLVMARDADGFLHLSGNMHCVPLVYFRTQLPGDITTFARHAAMTGERESRVTYPQFFHGADNGLLFTYRDGQSGSGDQLTNRYEAETQTWHRLMDKPLTNGEGQRNAYLKLPRLESDGFFHLVWVWRETPDAATNHDLSYARSRDLVRWEKSDNTPLSLPITLSSGEIVDPVPVGGGMINGNVAVGLDSQNRAVVTYHKHDPNGNTQIYAARREASGWTITQVTYWNYRWEFGGGGSIPFHLRIGEPVRRLGGGRLLLPFEHIKFGRGRLILSEETLRPLQTLAGSGLPPELETVTSDFPGMEVRKEWDAGTDAANRRFLLRYETLGPNRDRARTEALPPAQLLHVVEVR